MTDVTDQFNPDQNISIRVEQIEIRFGFFQHLIALALIPLGGIFMIAWIALLGWTAGKIFYLW